MPTLEDFASNEQIKAEYKKTFLLSLFRKICVKMNRNPQYRTKIQTLFRETHDKAETTQIIVRRELKYDLSRDEAKQISEWIWANLKKSSRRKAIPLSVKRELYVRQNGKCTVCGEPLGTDWSAIHVDHIIPWALVGDELPDNYQDLCETCNECKSARTDYIFQRMIELI